MATPKPPAATVFQWLRAQLGKKALAPLTGTDAKAIQAAVQILELYAYERQPDLLDAFRLVVMKMQPKCYEFAYHAIAHVLDWPDRFDLWTGAALPHFTRRMRCENE